MNAEFSTRTWLRIASDFLAQRPRLKQYAICLVLGLSAVSIFERFLLSLDTVSALLTLVIATVVWMELPRRRRRQNVDSDVSNEARQAAQRAVPAQTTNTAAAAPDSFPTSDAQREAIRNFDKIKDCDFVIGVTGMPGVGKSSLIRHLLGPGHPDFEGIVAGPRNGLTQQPHAISWFTIDDKMARDVWLVDVPGYDPTVRDAANVNVMDRSNHAQDEQAVRGMQESIKAVETRMLFGLYVVKGSNCNNNMAGHCQELRKRLQDKMIIVFNGYDQDPFIDNLHQERREAVFNQFRRPYTGVEPSLLHFKVHVPGYGRYSNEALRNEADATTLEQYLRTYVAEKGGRLAKLYEQKLAKEKAEKTFFGTLRGLFWGGTTSTVAEGAPVVFHSVFHAYVLGPH